MSLMEHEADYLTVFGVMALFMAGLLAALVLTPHSGEVEPTDTMLMPPPRDIPLLTAEAKADAMNTGYAVFKVGTMTYVVENLPEKYL